MARTLVKEIISVRKNLIINGNMDFWQRGITFTASGYLADRWRTGYDGTGSTTSITRQNFATSQTEVPENPKFFLRYQVTSPGSGGTVRYFGQRVENVLTLNGQISTYSFWAKSDSNRTVSLIGTQYFGTGGSPSANVVFSVGSVDLTTSWKKHTVTFSVPSTTTKTVGTLGGDFVEINLVLPINTNFTVDIAQVMWNVGEVAAPFNTAGASPTEEFSLCKRYYEVAFGTSVPGKTAYTNYNWTTVKRVIPVISLFSGNLSGATFDASGPGTYRCPAGVAASGTSDWNLAGDAEL